MHLRKLDDKNESIENPFYAGRSDYDNSNVYRLNRSDKPISFATDSNFSFPQFDTSWTNYSNKITISS